MPDLTIVFYTANVISDHFAKKVQNNLLTAINGLPVISVSKKPMSFGYNTKNICVGDTPRTHFNIYRQALIGAKAATTKYIALCEDDVLYSPEHFKYRPTEGKFAYDLGCWSVFTWGEPMFTHKGTVRRNLNTLICERELFIEAMEERFAKYPNDEANKNIWAEPGKYERQLGVTVRETEEFYSNPPNIVFSHQSALSYETLGQKKRLGEFRAYDLPYWGHISEVMELYK